MQFFLYTSFSLASQVSSFHTVFFLQWYQHVFFLIYCIFIISYVFNFVIFATCVSIFTFPGFQLFNVSVLQASCAFLFYFYFFIVQYLYNFVIFSHLCSSFHVSWVPVFLIFVFHTSCALFFCCC